MDPVTSSISLERFYLEDPTRVDNLVRWIATSPLRHATAVRDRLNIERSKTSSTSSVDLDKILLYLFDARSDILDVILAHNKYLRETG